MFGWKGNLHSQFSAIHEGRRGTEEDAVILVQHCTSHVWSVSKSQRKANTQGNTGRTVTVQHTTRMFETKPAKHTPWKSNAKRLYNDYILALSVTVPGCPPCVGTLPVPLSQYAQLPTPLTGPLTDPRAQRLQREGLSVHPGPHASFSGGQHRRRKRRGGGRPGQSGRLLARTFTTEISFRLWSKEGNRPSGMESGLGVHNDTGCGSWWKLQDWCRWYLSNKYMYRYKHHVTVVIFMGRWNVGADFIDFPTLVKDNKRSSVNNNN